MKSWLKSICVMLMIGIPFLLGACSKESEKLKNSNTPHSDRIQIVTTISQIGEPIEVIGGDRVEVESLMGLEWILIYIRPHKGILIHYKMRTSFFTVAYILKGIWGRSLQK